MKQGVGEKERKQDVEGERIEKTAKKQNKGKDAREQGEERRERKVIKAQSGYCQRL